MNIVTVAISQIGSSEKDLNQIEYNKWYYNRDVWGGSYPYCAVFVSWCANKAGLNEDIIPRTASVKNMKEFFIKNKRFHTIASGYRPTLGDLMIQQYNGANHVGIVVDVDPLGFTTVEGNSGEGVQQCRHGFNEPEIVGFAVPNYPESIDFKLQAFNDSNNRMSENELWNWMKGKGYNDNGAAALLAKIKQGNTRLYNSWHETTPTSTTFGLFNWKWEDIKVENNPTYGLALSQEDIQKYKTEKSGTTLSQYIVWCENKGVSIESPTNQIEYMAELKGEIHWGILNNKSLEDSVSIVELPLGKTPNDIKIAQEILSSYGGKTAEEVSATTPATTMREIDSQTVENLGIYNWTTITVQEGQTLDSIAAKYNTTPQLIIWGNHLGSWEVVPGDTIKVPWTKHVLERTEIAKYDDSLPILKHTSSVQVTHPTAYVLFYGEYGRLAATSASDKRDQSEYMDYDLISLNTSRALSQDNPTFSVSLVWRNKWYDNLASNDLVIIQLQRPGEQLRTVFFGLIDDIRKSMDFSSTQPQRSVVVTGRGFSKALCQFDISEIANFANNIGGNSHGGFFFNVNAMASKSSSFNIKLVLEAYLDKALRYKFADGSTLKDYMGYKGENYLNEKLVNVNNFLSFNGNIWNFIKELTNEPFNETFWEIKDGCPYLFHRPTPFEHQLWNKLNRTTIKDFDIIADNTGRSDKETYTAFHVDLIVDDKSTKHAYPPVYYPPLYDKYGMRMYRVNSRYIVTPGDSNDDKNRHPGHFIQQMANFYIKNNIMENGTITVKGSNVYKIGERIILESSNMEYYVEGVNHNFNMYGTWTTSLQVTRGLKPSERFTPPYGSCIDLTNDLWTKILGMTYGYIPDWSTAKAGWKAVGTTTATTTTTASQGAISSISIPGEGKGLEDMQKANLQFRSTPSQRTSTTEIIIHHPYMFGSVEDVHAIHLQRKDEKGNPWIGIGYNLYIRQDGSLWEGRGVDTIGAHCFTFNPTSIGISIEGKFDKGVAPTQAQMATASKVIAELAIKYNLEISRDTVKGHCEHPNQDTATEKCTCPGSILTEGYLDKMVETAKALKSQATVKREESNGLQSVKDGKTYSYAGIQWTWPTPECDFITSPYGFRVHPVTGKNKLHEGLDIARENGETSGSTIVAAHEGKVIWAGPSSGYGNLIEILHPSGYSTRYAHMYDNGVLVEVGQQVQAGNVIGYIGSSGMSTGPHLHFETRKGVGESMGQQGESFDPKTIFIDK